MRRWCGTANKQVTEGNRMLTMTATGADATRENSADAGKLGMKMLAGLAEFSRMQGRYQEAESLLQQALLLAEETCGRDALEASVMLNNLAVLYKYMARFDEAAKLYRRSLRITKAL